MKSLVIKIIVALFKYTGLCWLLAKLCRGNGVSIIMYHNPSKAIMDSHFNWLTQKGYTFITLNELVNAIYKKDFSCVKNKSVVVTIDDSWRGNFELTGVFEKHGVRPTIFVLADYVGTNKKLWSDVARQNGFDYTQLVSQPMEQTLAFLKKFLDYDIEKEYDVEDASCLSMEQMQLMYDLVDFQCHGCLHRILPFCNDEELEQDIANCQDWLKEKFDIDSRDFTYPYGLYGQREMDVLKKLGFRSARTTKIGWNYENTDPMQLKIIDITDTMTVEKLDLAVVNLPSKFRIVFKIKRLLKRK